MIQVPQQTKKWPDNQFGSHVNGRQNRQPFQAAETTLANTHSLRYTTNFKFLLIKIWFIYL